MTRWEFYIVVLEAIQSFLENALKGKDAFVEEWQIFDAVNQKSPSTSAAVNKVLRVTCIRQDKHKGVVRYYFTVNQIQEHITRIREIMAKK